MSDYIVSAEGVSPLKAVRITFGLTDEQILCRGCAGGVLRARMFLIWAYDLLGLSTEEIAEKINVDVANVRRLRRDMSFRMSLNLPRFEKDFEEFKSYLKFGEK